MKISIVTPSFNQGEYIEETIKSVIGQNYPHLEYFVIDGGSTDNSTEIIKKYEKKISYWISEPDKGQSDAVNKGLRKMSGDIIAYLNSDDTYLPQTFQIVSNYFENNPDCMVLAGGFYVIDSNSNILYLVDYGSYCKKELQQGLNRIGQHSVFWRKEVMSEVGYFREDLHYSMDFEYWLRIGQKFKFHFIYTPLASYRIHENAKTHVYYSDQIKETKTITQSYGFSSNRFLKVILDTRMRIIKWNSMLRSGYLIKHFIRKLGL